VDTKPVTSVAVVLDPTLIAGYVTLPLNPEHDGIAKVPPVDETGVVADGHGEMDGVGIGVGPPYVPRESKPLQLGVAGLHPATGRRSI
jgi:hypothetical protein